MLEVLICKLTHNVLEIKDVSTISTDICAVKVLCLQIWSFLVWKSVSVRESCRYKIKYWKISKRVTFWGRQKEKYLRLHQFVRYCSIHVWQKFYAIWEFYREKEAFCLGRIAYFGLLNISRLLGQLCQHQI